jgi:hypothetical protein
MPGPSTLIAWPDTGSADPGAGAEFTITVPAGKSWELIAVYVVLVQGITQTPRPILVIDDGTDILAEAPVGVAVAASTTVAITWGVDLPRDAALVGTTPDARLNCPLPKGLLLGSGYRARSVTLGIGANTNYGVARAAVVEYG